MNETGRVLIGVIVISCAARAHAAEGAPTVVVVDDDVRVRRADVALARSRGRAVTASGGEVSLVALRGETVAFQVVVIAGATPLDDATMSMGEVAPAGGAATGGRRVHVDVFREHYVPVTHRSRNRHRPRESLGWEPEARPSDEEMLGDIPDALIPIAVDATPVAPRPAVPAGQTRAFWVDVFVPEAAAPGAYAGEGQVRAGGVALAHFTVKLTVAAAVLPYRVTGAFAFYAGERLDQRMDNGDVIERQLWQLLHAHHLDALAQLDRDTDVKRLASAYDGSLFRAAAGYVGPGEGVRPSIVAFGAYGALGGPKDESLGRVDDMAAALPAGIDDVFLFAIDEQCKSERGADWMSALAARPAGKHGRVRVGQTCDAPPETQPVDIAMIPAQAFTRAAPQTARGLGHHAWIYNGELPRTGTLLLDADPSGLVADGWISAAFGIERWFYWETIFWDDDNAGGKGRIDPFSTPESFHNDEGDTALGDGMLLYPGRQIGRFAPRSLGVAAVLPSIRLKAIRRGIEDAGLIALAAREHADEVARLVMKTVPAALDEAPPVKPAAWDAPGARSTFSEARAALRALITNPAPLALADARASFDVLAAGRPQAVPLALTRRAYKIRRLAIRAGAALGMGLLGLVAVLVFSARVRAARRRET